MWYGSEATLEQKRRTLALEQMPLMAVVSPHQMKTMMTTATELHLPHPPQMKRMNRGEPPAASFLLEPCCVCGHFEDGNT